MRQKEFIIPKRIKVSEAVNKGLRGRLRKRWINDMLEKCSLNFVRFVKSRKFSRFARGETGGIYHSKENYWFANRK